MPKQRLVSQPQPVRGRIPPRFPVSPRERALRARGQRQRPVSPTERRLRERAQVRSLDTTFRPSRIQTITRSGLSRRELFSQGAIVRDTRAQVMVEARKLNKFRGVSDRDLQIVKVEHPQRRTFWVLRQKFATPPR